MDYETVVGEAVDNGINVVTQVGTDTSKHRWAPIKVSIGGHQYQ